MRGLLACSLVAGAAAIMPRELFIKSSDILSGSGALAPVYGEAVSDPSSPTGISIKISSEMPALSSQTVAWAVFTDTLNSTGWANFEVHGLRNLNDSAMSYAAGALEGVLTWQRTYDFIINAVIEAGQVFPKDLTNWIDTNTQYSQTQAAKNGQTDPFWYQTGLLFDQLQGLYDGYSSAAPKNRQLPFLPFYAGTLVGDLFDIDILFPDGVKENSPLFRRLTRPDSSNRRKGKAGTRLTHCSAMIGLQVSEAQLELASSGGYASPCAAANASPQDVFMAHATWAGYESMSRIFKLVDLPVALTGAKGSALVPGTRTTFSSYPATLYSSDDVYSTNAGAGMLITETTINNDNEELFKYMVPESVLCWARVMLAARLATSGASFASYFLKENSGTYNNQWMVLDRSKFVPGQPLQDGLLTVVEQLPGPYTNTSDQTDALRQQCYWGSYNVIHNPELAQIAGQDELEKEFGPLYSWANTSRALIFARELKTTGQPGDPSNKVIDLASIQQLMRLNDFQTEDIAIAGMGCSDKGVRNSANAIAARYDLNSDASESCDGGGIFAFGAIDTKITSLLWSFPQGQPAAQSSLPWLAISGPTYEGQPVYAFHNSSVTDVPHRGLPDAWKFPWLNFSYPITTTPSTL